VLFGGVQPAQRGRLVASWRNYW